MVHINKTGAYLVNGQLQNADQAHKLPDPATAKSGSMAHRVLMAHHTPADDAQLHIRFDAMTSHDITYVSIIQSARVGGMKEFPLPYILTNCHNSLCAVGGTINEDDHSFGLSAAKKYGGDFVPPHIAVMHQYMREMAAGCGKMILGSDSHTRYGALGCISIGEGGPELVKQLLKRTYDIKYPPVTAVYLTGAPNPGVGPQDVALALIKEVFAEGLVKNHILEFVGPGVANLSVDYRMGIDVMTTETACLSSIWQTDDLVRDYLALHGRQGDYTRLEPEATAWYDGVAHIELDKVEPMIALPFHPSNAYPISFFNANAKDLLAEVEKKAKEILPNPMGAKLLDKVRGGRMHIEQGTVAGCSGGTFENITRMAHILKNHSVGNAGFTLSVYPASQPQYLELVKTGAVTELMMAGAVIKTAFCGPCFGAGDTPANQHFAIRHTTRNFPNREGSKPDEGQISYVALMDARSIAATARNQGAITAATEIPGIEKEGTIPYHFEKNVYANKVYFGWGRPDPKQELVLGPNITDWPHMPPLPENLLLGVGAAIFDPVTTTDELIPSGETSSLRSNPLRLSEFALRRREPAFLGRAHAMQALEKARLEGLRQGALPAEVRKEFDAAGITDKADATGIGSMLFALRPGDGSAREQAASCQKVLGGWANIAADYATKRYRSNMVNWGLLPFIIDGAEKLDIKPEDRILIQGVRTLLQGDGNSIDAVLIRGADKRPLRLMLPGITREERDIILAGCLINYYAAN